MLRSLHRNIKLRLFESFINSLLGCMVFPFMIIYYAEHFGEVLSGILTTINIAIGCLSGFYGGHISDKFGRRKLLMITTSIEVLSFACMSIANYSTELPIITLLCSSLNAIIYGFSSPASQAMTLDATSEHDRKFVYSLQYWLHNLAFLIGSLIGGLLFLEHKYSLMIMMSIGALFSLFLLKFFIKELHVVNTEQKQNNMITNYLAILKDRRFILFMLGASFLGSVEFGTRNYLAVKCAAEGSLFNYTVLISENTFLVVFVRNFFFLHD